MNATDKVKIEIMYLDTTELSEGYQHLVAAAFKNADNERIVSFQLIKNGKAQAICDMRNETCERFDATAHVREYATSEWLPYCLNFEVLVQ